MGVLKTELRILLDNTNLENLLSIYNIKTLAKLYDTNTEMIHTVLNKQLSKKRYNKVTHKIPFRLVDEDKMNCNNEWSKLKQTEMYKQLINR